MWIRRTARVGSAVVVSLAALTAIGCNTQQTAATTQTSNAGSTSVHKLGFVVLVDGELGVVDMLNFEKVQSIKVGHYGVHQVAVLPDNRTVYTGNRDDNTLVKLTLSEDGKSYTQKILGKSPINLHLFTASPDGRYVVITSRMELSDEESKVFLPSGLPDDSIAILDTQTDKVIKTIALHSPAMASFPADGKHLYINNVHGGTVSVIDTATWNVVDTLQVADQALAPLPDGQHRIAPDGLDVSPDGKWLASADYDLGTVTVWETANTANKRHITYAKGDGLPHDVRWSPDSKELWVTDYDRHPVPADEVGNNAIATHLRVFDVADLKQLRTVPAPRKIQRISLPQYSKAVFLTTGIGSVLMLDRQTGAMEGEVVFGALGRPVVCGMTSY
jgi:YVTN family beta-propeller protein